MKSHVSLILPLCWVGIALGQQDVGYVSNSNATIDGALTVSRGHTALGPSSSLTTDQWPARVVLARGGMLTVCQSSAVHLEVAQNSHSALKPLRLSVNLGSMEILTLSTPNDSIIAASGIYVVPTLSNHEQTGVLHLAMRVEGNGQTCVENRSNRAPVNVLDANGHGSYVLEPGQQALFSNGSVKDYLSSPKIAPCGCTSVVSNGSSNLNAAHVPGGDKNGFSHEDGGAFPFPSVESRNAPEPEVLDNARIKNSRGDSYAPALVIAELDAAFASSDRDKVLLPANVLTPPAPSVKPSSQPLSPTRGIQEHASIKTLLADFGRFFKRLFSF